VSADYGAVFPENCEIFRDFSGFSNLGIFGGFSSIFIIAATPRSKLALVVFLWVLELILDMGLVGGVGIWGQKDGF
jgi:hypothetical protein